MFLLRVQLATDADIDRAVGVAARSLAYFRELEDIAAAGQ
jgi:hypothetical protein